MIIKSKHSEDDGILYIKNNWKLDYFFFDEVKREWKLVEVSLYEKFVYLIGFSLILLFQDKLKEFSASWYLKSVSKEEFKKYLYMLELTE